MSCLYNVVSERNFFSFVIKSWALIIINLFFLHRTYFDPAQRHWPATKLESELWKVTCPHSLKRRVRLHQLRAARCSFIALREAAVLDRWRVAAAGKTFLQDKRRLTIIQDHRKQTYKDHQLSKSCARFFAGRSCTSSKKSTM